GELVKLIEMTRPLAVEDAKALRLALQPDGRRIEVHRRRQGGVVRQEDAALKLLDNARPPGLAFETIVVDLPRLLRAHGILHWSVLPARQIAPTGTGAREPLIAIRLGLCVRSPHRLLGGAP